MEIAKASYREKLKSLFFKEKVPFSKRTDVDWKMIRNCALASIGFALLILLFLPSQKQQQADFHEKVKPENSIAQNQPAQDPTEQTLNQMNQGAFDSRPGRLSQGGGGASNGGNTDRSASMILTRSGQDSRTQIPPGSRVSVRLVERVIVGGSSGVPVIGLVTHDFVQEDSVAIPEGSKVFGQASFDGESGRAKVDWQSIQLSDGRTRQLNATSIGSDGQAGVDGDVHSNALKNTVGATLTRFIGAYAEGSMERGALGGSPGGSANGLKNAVSQTAQDRANDLADDLKTQKRWIELKPETEFFAVLTSSFVFRDPGATGGR